MGDIVTELNRCIIANILTSNHYKNKYFQLEDPIHTKIPSPMLKKSQNTIEQLIRKICNITPLLIEESISTTINDWYTELTHELINAMILMYLDKKEWGKIDINNKEEVQKTTKKLSEIALTNSLHLLTIGKFYFGNKHETSYTQISSYLSTLYNLNNQKPQNPKEIIKLTYNSWHTEKFQPLQKNKSQSEYKDWLINFFTKKMNDYIQPQSTI